MARRPLEDYDRKRDFGRTPEPAPAPPVRRAGEPIFVVHRHEARRLHYDLRLERGGVLCSWAVPKGFSYDPADKHLAIRTEDHPLEYERFHGVIPKGEYGAGTMTIWDTGRYELLNAGDPGADPAADPIAHPIERGDVKLVLRGRRLRGEWHLVKTTGGPNHWLLFKSRDRYVGGGGGDSALGIDLRTAPEKPPPRSIRRMQAGERCAPFSEAGWLFEARFDGRRVLAVKEGESVRLRGLRRRLYAVEQDLRAIRAENAILDGVLVAMDDEQRPSRELLERRLAAGDEEGVVLYAFDLLYYEDYDLRALPQIDRKAGLRALLPPLAHVAFMDHVPGNGEALVEAVTAAGLTGVIAKRADAPYRAGPSGDWREIDVASPSASSGLTVTDALARSGRSRRSRSGGSSRSRVKLSNLEKVYWPADGFTKGDLLAYYEHVADVLLPYLEDRPVHLNRFPDGIDGKSFYQKEAKEGTPGWIRTVELASRHREGGTLEYMVCDDRDTLLYLVNLGSIDLHPWMSRVSSPDEPDYAVIDLDPKGAPFSHVVRIAREVGRVLRGIGMRPLLKTSGKTGLHVVLPLEPGTTYEQSVLFCEGVARVVTRDLRDIATVERALSSREGKVYVDFGQNRKGQTIVPPYVVRPVRGATVSAPLAWDELDTDVSPSLFTIQTMPPRLERLGDLFRPLFTDRQSLSDAAEALEQYLRKR